MATQKIDFKKENPEFYNPSKSKFTSVIVPSMQFFMIEGEGDPNTSQLYKDAITTLYASVFTLKMAFKKKPHGKDYVIPPLEGLWYMDDMSKWSIENKNEWKWTMMIRIPDFIPKDDILAAIEVVKKTKREKAPLIDQLKFNPYEEGNSMQILYIGAYKDEGPLIQNLHKAIKEQGHSLRGYHHEIYLSDPRKTVAEKLKTIIRQPFS